MKPVNTQPTAEEITFNYHERTKHFYNRFARSLGYLDWKNQPDPFRVYEGAREIGLPFVEDDETPLYESLYSVPTNPRKVTVESLSLFLESSLGISAWKEYEGTRWALRCNPSSGNLHPTEGYLICAPIEGLSDRAAVYHYAPKEHALECRACFAPEVWNDLVATLPGNSFLVGLSSITWREEWKYGERAFRYCQHDLGHALAAYSFAASMLGWRVIHLDALSDECVASLIGLGRTEDFEAVEAEQPALLAAVVPAVAGVDIPRGLPSLNEIVIPQSDWRGKANRLSSDHEYWNVIESVTRCTAKPETESSRQILIPLPSEVRGRGHNCALTARQIIQQRRSAVAMDGRTFLSRDDFYIMLERLMPRPGAMLWDVMSFPVTTHLCLFVHRVNDLAPGLYFLFRDRSQEERIRKTIRKEFSWKAPPGCPSTLPLYLLEEGNVQSLAAQVSCGQDIAGAGCFSLGMVVDFDEQIRENGAWHYRRLFWETGMVGQLLYLEAEAAGMRSTGIGCFFDDPVHDVFGFADRTYQSLYHFTVGGPIEDTRLTTIPPYSEERRAWKRA